MHAPDKEGNQRFIALPTLPLTCPTTTLRVGYSLPLIILLDFLLDNAIFPTNDISIHKLLNSCYSITLSLCDDPDQILLLHRRSLAMNREIQKPSNRKFGYFFGFVFFIVALYSFLNDVTWLSFPLLGLSLLTFVIAYSVPDLLRMPNKWWFVLGSLIGKFVSPIVLGVIFFCVFTPIGFFLRLFGRDELRLRKFGSQTTSYWRVTKEKKTNFFDQF